MKIASDWALHGFSGISYPYLGSGGGDGSLYWSVIGKSSKKGTRSRLQLGVSSRRDPAH